MSFNCRISLAPLILFAASPGTISGVITLVVAHSRLEIPVTALIAVGVATAIMWLAIMLGVLLGTRDRGDSFVRFYQPVTVSLPADV